MGSTASTFTRAVKNSLGSASTKFTKSNHLVYYDRIIDRTKFLYRWYSELRADACAFTKDEDVINKCPGNVPEVEWVVLNGQNAEGSLNIWEIEAFDTNGIELNFGTGSVIDGQSSTNVKTCYDGKNLSPNTCTSKYLKTEWAFSITSQDITQSVGATVTQGTSTGTLKTALTGAGVVNVIINAAAGVTFVTTADVIIGTGGTATTIVHANVNSATYSISASGTLKTTLQNEWIMIIAAQVITNENVGVTVTQGVGAGMVTGTLRTLLQNEWQIDINSQDITENAGVTVTFGETEGSGTLKTALTGTGTISVVIQIPAYIEEIGSANIVIGSTTVVAANVGTATKVGTVIGATTSVVIQALSE